MLEGFLEPFAQPFDEGFKLAPRFEFQRAFGHFVPRVLPSFDHVRVFGTVVEDRLRHPDDPGLPIDPDHPLGQHFAEDFAEPFEGPSDRFGETGLAG